MTPELTAEVSDDHGFVDVHIAGNLVAQIDIKEFEDVDQVLVQARIADPNSPEHLLCQEEVYFTDD